MTAIDDARSAIAEIAELHDRIAEKRAIRDHAIWRAARQEGVREPDIHRALGGSVSLSSVRLAVSKGDLRSPITGTDHPTDHPTPIT